jgi:hypothetical protein
VKTTGAGVAQIQVVPTALTYTINVSVTGPWGKVWTNIPSKGRQHLIGAGPQSTVTSTACATVCPVTARINIDAPCEGSTRHTLTVDFRAESIPGTYRGFILVNGTRTVADLKPGQAATITTQISDGDTLQAGWEILGDRGDVLVTRTLYTTASIR